MKRRLRPGWFSKALRKWARLRLYRYTFTDAKVLYSAFGVEKYRDGGGTMTRSGYIDTDVEQVARRVLHADFVDGFIIARRLARKYHDKFRCYTDKVTRLT